MSTPAPVDVDVLRGEIQKTYTNVSENQEQDFIFPTGRYWAERPRLPGDGARARPRGEC